jgi:hypothetical protein
MGWVLVLGACLAQAQEAMPGAGGDCCDRPVGAFNQFWHRCKLDFHRNNSWPEPFLSADRQATRTPFCLMVDNGWKMHNTIGSFLFDPHTQRVNQAGELLVKWIVTQAPTPRRVVFVLQGDTPEATAARVESVQAVVAKYAGGAPCPVLLTSTEPAGWSAAYIDTITQQYHATIQAPRLPPPQGSNQSATGGGGGGSSTSP